MTEQLKKDEIVKAANNQKFISSAPVIIICCANINDYKYNSMSGVNELKESDYIDDGLYLTLQNRIDNIQIGNSINEIAFNVAIAVEHMVLRAVEFGIGSCWIGFVDNQAVRKLFNFDKNLVIVSLLALGYPDEEPKARKRLPISDIIIK